MLFDKLTPVRLSEQVASRIEALILDSQLRPGDKLPSERELSTSFGVSRPSIRESIKLLEERGLVASRSGRGVFIMAPAYRGFTSSISLAYHMQACTADDMHEARWCLESFSARLAAERATEEDISRMEKALGQMDASMEDPGSYVVADAAFHAALAASTQNPLFPAMTRPLVEMIMSHGHAAYPHGMLRERHERHRQLLEFIKNRDASAAEEAMRSHLNLSREAFSLARPASGPTDNGRRGEDGRFLGDLS